MKKKEFKFKNSQGEEFEVVFKKPNKAFFGNDCDGYCTASRVAINPHRGPQTVLNTSIHEFAHAHFWDKPEKDVKKFADSLSRFLYNHCGWRLKQDGKWPRIKGAMAGEVLAAWRERQGKK